MVSYRELEKKWQQKWNSSKVFKTDFESDKPKFYCLEMFSYPSGKLHMGHVRNYSIGDCYARFLRMNGKEVLYPVGYDALGLPAENAAIKNDSHPKDWTTTCMSSMTDQLKMMGFSYDFDALMPTCEPGYYKWNQWFFIQFLKKGLAYKKDGFVNWCPECNTVLANEQVENGKCWRHGKTDVIQKPLDQWYLDIKKYADELLFDIDDKLQGWPEKVKTMQKNWIGRSEGTLIKFKVKGMPDFEVSTFTTRVDTIYGITYLVYAPEHQDVLKLVEGTEYESDVKKFIAEVQKENVFDRTAEGKEKHGMFTGRYGINPITGDEFPIWIANYALADYGTGAVMAVPAHDQRDFEFAKKYELPIKLVITPRDHVINPEKMIRAFADDGVLVNSGEFDTIGNRDAIPDLQEKLKELNAGGKTTSYKLRDWLISRQRYWGTPIPILYCDKCGIVPEKEENLPVMHPDDVVFDGDGNPMEKSECFKNATCPECGGHARRETDTMDTFFDSSWYFLRFIDRFNDEKCFDKEMVNKWMSVDQYIGGIEHACMHLIYARFFTKALRDLGLCDVDEPFTKLLTQGMVIKDGAKMSKSIGNVVDPGEIIEKYGADTARLFILFAALPEKELDWSDEGVAGANKFVSKVYNAVFENEDLIDIGEFDFDSLDNKSKHVISKLHLTIKEVTKLIEEFKFSLAIGKMMEFVTALYKYKGMSPDKNVYTTCVVNTLKLMAPITPHMCEECFEKLGQEGFISVADWPKYDENMIDKEANASEEMIHNVFADISNVIKLAKVEKPSKVTLIISNGWKFDLFKEFKTKYEETKNVGELIKHMMGVESLSAYRKNVQKVVAMLCKNPTRIPSMIMTAQTEKDALAEVLDEFKAEYGCDVEVVLADEYENPKSGNAIPGKPAILVC